PNYRPHLRFLPMKYKSDYKTDSDDSRNQIPLRLKNLPRSKLLPERLLRFTPHQVIGDREDIGNSVGTNPGHILVGLTIHDALKCNLTILDDNADRFDYRHGILFQRGIPIDGAIKLHSQLVIHGGDWKHFDLVVDVLHTLNAFHDPFGVFLERWICNIAFQRYIVSVYRVAEVIEDVVIGEHQELVADFSGNSIGALL